MPRVRRLATLLFAAALLLAPAARSASSDIVVSQVYAGGGNSGATYTNDFVELFNRGSSAIDLSSWSIQYASASGTTWQATALSGSVQPGRYYLVQLASAAAIGLPLPAPDAIGTSNLAVSGG
jgi:predicted extracellular nuclease